MLRALTLEPRGAGRPQRSRTAPNPVIQKSLSKCTARRPLQRGVWRHHRSPCRTEKVVILMTDEHAWMMGYASYESTLLKQAAAIMLPDGDAILSTPRGGNEGSLAHPRCGLCLLHHEYAQVI